MKIAAAGGDVAIVQALLDAHAAVDARSDQSYVTALIVAAGQGYTEIVKRLLAAGADRNATDKGGTNLLMAAAASGATELMDVVLPLGFDVNAKRKEGGETALDFALGYHNWAIVRLFDKGASLDSSKVGRGDILSALLKRVERTNVGEGLLGLPNLAIDENVVDADADLFKKAIALGAR